MPILSSLQALAAAKVVAERAITALEGAGIFGVEMFLLADGSVLLNEVAPRPHNRCALARPLVALARTFSGVPCACMCCAGTSTMFMGSCGLEGVGRGSSSRPECRSALSTPHPALFFPPPQRPLHAGRLPDQPV